MSNTPAKSQNIDPRTVEGFGQEWEAFSQESLDPAEQRQLFDAYFSIFPFDTLAADAEGFDIGCGSGRWAALAAPKVGLLHCIDPAAKALAVARRRLRDVPNVDFREAAVDNIPLQDGSQDFGYALGVLHHVPDTEAALASCVRKLKPGAPLLFYLYYAFDNRPAWFRAIWRLTEPARGVISKLPFRLRKGVTDTIAVLVYLPLSRTARLIERTGRDVGNFPLSAYRNASLYTLRTDALDRFGTRLEHRFTKAQIRAMAERVGLRQIVFSESIPFWVACARKAPEARRDR